MLKLLIIRQLKLANASERNYPNDGDASELYLNAIDKCRIATFYTIVDKLETEMRKKEERYINK